MNKKAMIYFIFLIIILLLSASIYVIVKINKKECEIKIPHSIGAGTENMKEKDFFYINKDKCYIIWLGMDKKNGLAIVGPINNSFFSNEHVDDETYSPNKRYCYKNECLGFDDNELFQILANRKKNDNWVSYNGINNKTSIEDVYRILGKPTYQTYDEYEMIDELTFIFRKIENKKYIKVKDIDEFKMLAESKNQVVDMRMFSIGYKDDGLMDFFGISRVVIPAGSGWWTAFDSNKWWLNYFENEW